MLDERALPPRGELDPATLTLVDVETTGLSPTANRVLALAVIRLDGSGRVASEFSTLVDPGQDTGPVHIHGITRADLVGAPKFDEVMHRVSAMLEGRILVAHNAGFDTAFLAAEFERAGGRSPITSRMCTLVLARRVAPPTRDFRLASLAEYYLVPQVAAHDALDDTRVLSGVLRGLLRDADQLGVRPPVVTCLPAPGRSGGAGYSRMRSGPKPPCEFRNPGRLVEPGPLVQGMKIAISGETSTARHALTRLGERAGLDMVGAVSRHTSVLVSNGTDSGATKVRRAVACGTPIIAEARFLSLLDAVEPGLPKSVPIEQRAGSVAQGVRGAAVERSPVASAAVRGPLAGRRVLVLGGDHRRAGDCRARVIELGGSAAVNLSRSVTDVLALDGAQADRRFARVRAMRLPVHGEEIVFRDSGTSPSARASAGAIAVSRGAGTQDDEGARIAELARGEVVDLPVGLGAEWCFRVSWAETSASGVDVLGFLLDDREQVSGDEDFAFFNQPIIPGARLEVDGPTDQCLTLRLAELPDQARRVVLAAAVDGEDDFGAIGAVEVEVCAGHDRGAVIRTTLDAATTERTMILMEVYLRRDVWRVRAVGQGYETGLAELAASFGVVVDGDD